MCLNKPARVALSFHALTNWLPQVLQQHPGPLQVLQVPWLFGVLLSPAATVGDPQPHLCAGASCGLCT